MPKVLLADDSTHAQRMGTKILSGEGIDVVTVSNGEAAVKKLDGEFDVVLADVFMPGRSGYELCAFIKNTPKYSHIPVVLVVGQLEPYDPEQGKKSRADGVLKKPFEASVVIETVRAMLVLSKERKPAPPPEVKKRSAEEIAAEHAADQKQMAEIAGTPKTERIQVPKDMEHSAAFDIFDGDEPAPGAPEPAPAAPTVGYGVEETTAGGSAYGVETTPETSSYGVETSPAASSYGVEAAAESASAYDAAPPAATADMEFRIEAPPPGLPAAGMEDVSIPGLTADIGEPEVTIDLGPPTAVEAVIAPELVAEPPALPARRWVAEPEAVTEMDRAFFGASAAVVADEPAAGAVPDWNDLLRSVEEPAPAAATPAPAPQPSPESAAARAPELETAPGSPAAPVEPVMEAAPAETTADATAPQVEAVAAEAVTVDAAKVRAGVESGLEKALPGMKSVPGLIETITAEVLRKLGVEP